MIRYGDRQSIPELKRLWKVCFEDEDAYIDAFFEALYEEDNVLLAEADGVLMGASFFLPGKIYVENDAGGFWQKIRYIYALAVYPEYRGRGIAGELMRRAYEIYQSPLVAEPAEEGLVGGFYEPLGFKKAFYLRKEQMEMPGYGVQAAELGAACLHETAQIEQKSRLEQKIQIEQKSRLEQKIQLEQKSRLGQKSQMYRKNQIEQAVWEQQKGRIEQPPQINQMRVYDADTEEYTKIRDKFFLRNNYISWPMRHTAFAIQEHCKNGGEALICERGAHKDLLLYYLEDGQAVVTETTLEAEQAAEVLWERISYDHAGRRDVCVWLPCCGKEIFEKNEDYRLMGVVYGITPVAGYLNLTLD